jgi:hypothetical protein
MKTLSLGPKKKTYKSIAEAARAVGLPYMVLYMRLRAKKKGGLSWSPSEAVKYSVQKSA